jgi:hypothetical protein
MWPVVEWALGYFQWNWARRCSSGPVGHRGPARLPFFFYALFPINSKAQVSKYKSLSYLTPKISKFGKSMDNFKTNKHPFWPNFQFSLDFEL